MSNPSSPLRQRRLYDQPDIQQVSTAGLTRARAEHELPDRYEIVKSVATLNRLSAVTVRCMECGRTATYGTLRGHTCRSVTDSATTLGDAEEQADLDGSATEKPTVPAN